MAGAKIQIEFQDAQVKAQLAAGEQALSPQGFRATLKDIGEYMLRATRELAAEEVSPDGSAWPSLSPRYAARKQKLRPGVPMLKFDNHMLGDELVYQIDDAGEVLFVGTHAPYGATQQFGRGAIPARPWLGINDADATKISQITLRHIRQAIQGASGPETPAA